MATEAPATLGEIEVFQHQARVAHQVVRVNVEGLTQEDSLVQPQPAGNCLNFVLGHLLHVYDQALPLVGQQPVLGTDALHRYRRGAPPLTDPAEAMQLSELLAAWDTASERFAAGLATLTPEAMERPMPGPDSGGKLTETVRSLLATILFHQSYHAGQAGVLRRIAGKPGAIP
ncbi:MAG TPA: DinB family protein [Longimicrobium sp.]|nr:DinB family protein [Longimicrobium sp.]